MKSIFGGLAGSKRVPTSEGLSDEDVEGRHATVNQEAKTEGLAKPIAYEEATSDGEESYYDEEEDGDQKAGKGQTLGKNLDEVELDSEDRKREEKATKKEEVNREEH